MIFVVEDDPNIRELVTYTLQSTGFDACGFENGSEFLRTGIIRYYASRRRRNIDFRKTSQKISDQRSADHYDDSKGNRV